MLKRLMLKFRRNSTVKKTELTGDVSCFCPRNSKIGLTAFDYFEVLRSTARLVCRLSTYHTSRAVQVKPFSTPWRLGSALGTKDSHRQSVYQKLTASPRQYSPESYIMARAFIAFGSRQTFREEKTVLLRQGSLFD